RRSEGHSCGNAARLCAGFEPVGPRRLAPSQTCGDGKSVVYGFGGVAFGTTSCHRAFTPKTSIGSVILYRSRFTCLKSLVLCAAVSNLGSAKRAKADVRRRK